MKPIDFCLDRILEELQVSWDNKDRPPLDPTSLLTEFEIQQDRHELFKSLINKMVDDGYVDFLDKVEDRKAAGLDTYKERTILTAVGYYFIKEDHGYTGFTKKEKSRKKIQNSKDWLTIVGTWLAGSGTIALFIWEVLKSIGIIASNC